MAEFSALGIPLANYAKMLQEGRQPLCLVLREIVREMEYEKNNGYPRGKYFKINCRTWEEKIRNNEIELPPPKKNDFKLSARNISRSLVDLFVLH